MEALFENLSIGLFAWQALVFVVLIFLLSKFAWKPILKAVNDRETSISDALNAAEKAKEEMKLLQSKNEDLLKEAREERDSILKEANAVKAKIVAEAKEQAKAEGDSIVAAAKESIDNEKMAAVSELKNQVAVLSIEIAEKIIRQELSGADKQKALADNLADEISLN